MRVYLTLLKRDLLLAFRHQGDWVNPLVFFVIAVTLFPLGLGPEVNLLTRIAPGIIWVAVLLAAMLSLESIFHSDYVDGTLEQMALSPHPLPAMVLAKILAHWLTTGLPMVLISPLLGVLLNMPADSIAVLMLTLLIGTPVLSLIGAIGVALTVSQRRGGVLLSLLVLPLNIPVLIFATGAVDMAATGQSPVAHLSLLGAILALAVTLAPFAAAAALRVSLE